MTAMIATIQCQGALEKKKKDEKVSGLQIFAMKYFLLLSEKQTFIVACLFFWLLGKFQTAIASVVLNFFSFFKK